MQAIILAAGMGRRLGELTKNNTKCMVPVNGVALIDRLLGQLAKEQLQRVIIVVGYKGKELIDFIGSRYDGQLNIEYADNPIYDKTNNIYSLALVKDKLQEDDTLLIESDLIFDDRMIPLIAKHPYPNLAMVAKYESWMDGTMVTIDKDCNIVSFVPKKNFSYKDIDQYYKTVNIYKFSKEYSQQKYVPFLDAYSKALGNGEFYEQVLRIMTTIGINDLKALPISNEKWYEIDDIQDLNIAETIFADSQKQSCRLSSIKGGYWRFPKILDFCNTSNPYFPTQRMKDELRSNFDALLTGFPSDMKVMQLLAGKFLGIKGAYTVVGNGVSGLIDSLMKHVDGTVGVVCPNLAKHLYKAHDERFVQFCPNNDDLRYNETDLINFFSNKGIKSLLLTNPNSFSGNTITQDGLLRLTAWSKQEGINLILDESFANFSNDAEHSTMIANDLLEANPHLMVMKSLSQSYGVPGVRLGILATANTSFIETLEHDTALWSTNSFAEFFLQIIGKYESDYKHACELLVAERNRLEQQLHTIPYLHVIPSKASSFLLEITGKFTAEELVQQLLANYDIMVKDCSHEEPLRGKNYIRISVRNTDNNDRLIKALKELA